jgi:hypothetical protein
MITLALPLAAVALLAQTRSATVLSIGDDDTLRVREGNRTVNAWVSHHAKSIWCAPGSADHTPPDPASAQRKPAGIPAGGRRSPPRQLRSPRRW